MRKAKLFQRSGLLFALSPFSLPLSDFASGTQPSLLSPECVTHAPTLGSLFSLFQWTWNTLLQNTVGPLLNFYIHRCRKTFTGSAFTDSTNCMSKKKKKNPESSKKQIWICFRPATFWPFTLVFTSEHLLIYWYSKVYGRMCIGYMQILHHFICYLSIRGFWYLRGSWNQFLRDNSVFMTCFWFSPSSLECFPP